MGKTCIYWLHCLTPTHPGIGRGVGYIDLPIDRDAVTGWPIIRGSSFKGVWADHFGANEDARKKDPVLRAAFGLVGTGNESNSGSLIPTDAQLVCLPVRSFRGTFAWATSPLCLRRLHRTLSLAGMRQLPPLLDNVPDGAAHHAQKTVLCEGQRIYLEDLDFKAVECPKANGWASKLASWVFPDDREWQTAFTQRFAVLADDVFNYLCETGTEVVTRVRLEDERKTVAEGALWTEELLPAETILAGIIQCERVFQPNGKENSITPDALIQRFANGTLSLQIGGKATVGRGQVRCVFTPI